MDTGRPAAGNQRRQTRSHTIALAAIDPELLISASQGREVANGFNFQQPVAPGTMDSFGLQHGPQQHVPQEYGPAEGINYAQYVGHEQLDAPLRIGNYDQNYAPYVGHEQLEAPLSIGNYDQNFGLNVGSHYGQYQSQVFDNDQQLNPDSHGPGGPQGFGDPPISDHGVDEAPSAVLETEHAETELAEADARLKSIADKEKRAQVVIDDQDKQPDAAQQMGTDVEMIQTATGLVFQGVYWKAPENDGTIPSSAADINNHINALVAGMLNNQGCREEATKNFRKIWADEAEHYTKDEFKGVCRELLMLVIDIHTNGWTKNIFDKAQRAVFQKTMFYTFQDRFEAILELLTYSKTSCSDIMKGARIYIIVGNPHVLIKRTKTNKKSNKKKAVRIAIGTQVQKTQVAKDEDPVPEEGGGEDKDNGEDMDEDELSDEVELSDEAEFSDPELSPSEEQGKIFEGNETKKPSRGKKRPHEDSGSEDDENPRLQKSRAVAKPRAKKARKA